MYVLHYKQQFCLIFHCVHVSITLEGETKSAIITSFPLWSEDFFLSSSVRLQKLNSAARYKTVKVSSM